MQINSIVLSLTSTSIYSIPILAFWQLKSEPNSFFGWRPAPDPVVETGAIHDASPCPGTSLPDSPPLDAFGISFIFSTRGSVLFLGFHSYVHGKLRLSDNVGWHLSNRTT